MILPTRLRKNKNIRRLVRETHLSMDDVIYPIFVVDGEGIRREIPSMKGQYHYSFDKLDGVAAMLRDKGIGHIMLFGVPAEKDAEASPAFADDGIIQRAARRLKALDPELYK